MAVEKFPKPKTQKAIRQFLELAGYYRRFIENFSVRAKPLSDLFKKGKEFSWGREQNRRFRDLRAALSSEPVLQYPDFSKQFTITTDASDFAVGAILSQEHEGQEKPIAYSRILGNAQKNYYTTEKECSAVVQALEDFQPYIYR